MGEPSGIHSWHGIPDDFLTLENRESFLWAWPLGFCLGVWPFTKLGNSGAGTHLDCSIQQGKGTENVLGLILICCCCTPKDWGQEIISKLRFDIRRVGRRGLMDVHIGNKGSQEMVKFLRKRILWAGRGENYKNKSFTIWNFKMLINYINTTFRNKTNFPVFPIHKMWEIFLKSGINILLAAYPIECK